MHILMCNTVPCTPGLEATALRMELAFFVYVTQCLHDAWHIKGWMCEGNDWLNKWREKNRNETETVKKNKGPIFVILTYTSFSHDSNFKGHQFNLNIYFLLYCHLMIKILKILNKSGWEVYYLECGNNS